MVDEAVRAEHGPAGHDAVTAGVYDDFVVSYDDPLGVGAVREVKPLREATLQVAQHLLADQTAVRAARARRQHRRVALVVHFEELPDPRPRDDVVQPGETGREALGGTRHPPRRDMSAAAALLARGSRGCSGEPRGGAG